jgi:glutamate-1-semialdehyde 2,1-aminomutase
MITDWNKSHEWYQRAQQALPGGVNSPVRAFRSVGGEPPFIRKANGAYLWDEDGNQYIDYICSWGAMILGHAHPTVVEALHQAASSGTSFGAPTSGEVLLAEDIRHFLPGIEMVRLVNSGTEATMSAIRLARAVTKRDRFIKFEGCYHGHGDSFLIAAGSGATTFGVPNSPGVTAGTAADTLLAPYNDLDAVRTLFQEQGDQIAAIILEPVAGNMGLIPPAPGFLEGLRQLTTEHGALLIFDEVMTGWRVDAKSAQGLFGIEPDLTTLGKVIGGGLPVGAYGGKREYMEQIAPSGPVYQAGTLSGNPLAVAAGRTTLAALKDPDVFAQLERRAAILQQGFQANIDKLGLTDKTCIQRLGTMTCLFFHPGPVTDYATAKESDTAAFGRYFQGMLKRGIHLPPSQFEALFLSTAHTDEDIHNTIQANYEALQEAW